MCTQLSYGTRATFVQGMDDLVEETMLTIRDEWRRDHTWTDWRGVSYTMLDEWEYVNGLASCKPNCTPGDRDANNAGKSVEDFLRIANEHIRSRRAEGYGLTLCEDFAFLTANEVLAVRLYTGPGYQLINAFLRSIHAHIHACIQACMHTYIYVRTYVHVRTHARMHTSTPPAGRSPTSPAITGARCCSIRA